MSVIHHETTRSPMTQSDHAARLTAEIIAINRAFLALLSDPLVAGTGGVLGLDAALTSRIAALEPDSRDRLATVPVSLADFALLSCRESESWIADQVADDAIPREWHDRVSAFSNRLLATLWHFSRVDNGLVGFCMGLDRDAAAGLAALSFTELSREATRVCSSLRARHADHPSCWPDLVRFARSDADERFSAARLGLIPLTVARMNSGVGGSAAR